MLVHMRERSGKRLWRWQSPQVSASRPGQSPPLAPLALPPSAIECTGPVPATELGANHNELRLMEIVPPSRGRQAAPKPEPNHAHAAAPPPLGYPERSQAVIYMTDLVANAYWSQPNIFQNAYYYLVRPICTFGWDCIARGRLCAAGCRRAQLPLRCLPACVCRSSTDPLVPLSTLSPSTSAASSPTAPLLWMCESSS